MNGLDGHNAASLNAHLRDIDDDARYSDGIAEIADEFPNDDYEMLSELIDAGDLSAHAQRQVCAIVAMMASVSDQRGDTITISATGTTSLRAMVKGLRAECEDQVLKLATAVYEQKVVEDERSVLASSQADREQDR